ILWLFTKRTIQQLFSELYALVFENPGIFLHATIQRHTDLPRTGKHLRILNRSFVHERICATRRVAFHDMQSVAMKITCAIEPGLVAQAGDVDHERLAFPTTIGPSHPAIPRSLRRGPHINDANGACVFVGHHNILWSLDDLKGIWKVGSAWYAGQITLDLGVKLHPVRLILLLLGGRCRQVRNLIALHNALTWRQGERRSQCGHWTLRGSVALEIPIGLIQSLPDTVQVRFSIPGTWRTVSRRLGSGQQSSQKYDCRCHACDYDTLRFFLHKTPLL